MTTQRFCHATAWPTATGSPERTACRDQDVVCRGLRTGSQPRHSARSSHQDADGDTTLVAAEGISIGGKVAIGDNVALRPGNITELGNILKVRRSTT